MKQQRRTGTGDLMGEETWEELVGVLVAALENLKIHAGISLPCSFFVVVVVVVVVVGGFFCIYLTHSSIY